MARYENFTATNIFTDRIFKLDGAEITPGVNPYGGMDYYVDNNYGSSGGTGLSWESPKKTLAQAITLSNANIAADARGYRRGFASRNRIFYRADTETADLIVFPNKCDVIGVGSYDANDKPGIIGNHVPVNAGNWGTRFFNIFFKAPADASPLVTLANTSSGIQFINSMFSATATTTRGILATASPFLKVINCRFEGAFVNDYINIAAGEAGGTEILNNVMVDGADNGVVINSSTTTIWKSIIAGNHIQCADLTIDDDSDLFIVTDNDLYSGENVGANSYDFNAKLANRNYIAGNDKNSIIPALT